MAEKPFKVIVSGAGPVGLTLAHALSKAGVDYLILEGRDEVVIDIGATIILNQATLRVLGQLGLLEKVKEAGVRFTEGCFRSATSNGRFGAVSLHKQFEDFGEYDIIIHRASLLSVLYDSLSEDDKSRILTGKKVTEILSKNNHVTVTCGDGSTHEGSILIGADGVGSYSRKVVRSLLLEAGVTDVDDPRPFLTTFKMVWFSAPRPEHLVPGTGPQSFGKPSAVQMLVGKDKCWIFLYERLETPTKESKHYTAEDTAEMVAKWGHLTCDDGILIKDLFAKHTKAGLINLEEGVAKKWSAGRVVLVGDAAHKFTPSAALGYNNGVQDIAVLLNLIVPLSRASNPTLDVLTTAFERYRELRAVRVEKDYQSSAVVTRSQTMDTFFLWFMARLVIPYFGFVQRKLVTAGSNERIREAYPLGVLAGSTEEPFHGNTAWEQTISAVKAGCDALEASASKGSAKFQ